MPNLAQLLGHSVVVIDFETTGIDPFQDLPIEVALIYQSYWGKSMTWNSFIDPGFPVPENTTRITGIRQEDMKGAKAQREAFQTIASFLEDNPIVVAHNAPFDLGFLTLGLARHKLPIWDGNFVCTRALATLLNVGKDDVNRAGRPYRSFKLGDVAEALGLTLRGAHRALHDVTMTAKILEKFYPMLDKLPNRQFMNMVVKPEWAPPYVYLPTMAEVVNVA